MKVIRVESCGQCPCLDWIADPYDIMCGGIFKAEYRRVEDVDSIPEWCPLPDAKEAENGQ